MTLLKAGLNGVGIFQAESTKDNDLSQGPQDFLGRHCGSDSYKQGKVRRGSIILIVIYERQSNRIWCSNTVTKCRSAERGVL